ncbi:DUF1801 domain-containing protein [Candidatus Woesebacteria bacterium]|nr:DUF1801 domain-containing protein [Candidatus Woesebacteria bacterium]
MSTIKTLVTDTPVPSYVASLGDELRRSEATELLKIFNLATGMEPKMWGTSIVGYGSYHYKSERSRQEGDWPLTAFSMRKSAISIYIMPGFDKYAEHLSRLGKHKAGVGCLYIKRLSDVDPTVLSTIINSSFNEMKGKYE